MENKINPDQLKEAMRTWITGVAIVTGQHNGDIHGMTANSFNSLALTPPTVLVALQNHSRTQKLVQEGGFFGVTILSNDQIELARRFAGQIDQDQPRFEGVDIFTLVSGVPLIAGGLAYLDCQVKSAYNVGATTMFIGEVLASQTGESPHEPLLYFNRRWRKLAQ